MTALEDPFGSWRLGSLAALSAVLCVVIFWVNVDVAPIFSYGAFLLCLLWVAEILCDINIPILCTEDKGGAHIEKTRYIPLVIRMFVEGYWYTVSLCL